MAMCPLVVHADRFKSVNDRFGHEAGDRVLQALASTLRQRLREVDLLARVGGEEFVAVLPDTESDQANHLAAALVARIAGVAVPVVGSVTVSIGVATVRAPDQTVGEALLRADVALYRAKHGGRNRHEFAVDADVLENRAGVIAVRRSAAPKRALTLVNVGPQPTSSPGGLKRPCAPSGSR